ncbi:hypothetical protein BCR32DRAFT_327910 [Anaeromyces robustus]|uniref:Jacalin-type lectin domain-containing protein n=1 Tax=Anaeromyces robustus TaxID=1754192 RepID=A0A1Y1X2T1_9FUNG|nr:hypothetical protein BCR32DRAFT_327910 [Anaeromyces robustus]|eukprot:ORX79938.1 hypothetical protein BCR32DRAFT_327910 [Anaeromyces robustus]
MKSFYLNIFSILTIFVITSKASVRNQIDESLSIEGGGYKIWLTEVNGYDENDEVNGYSGIFGEPVTSVAVSGGRPYTVHLLNGNWLKKIDGYNIANITDIYGYSGKVDGFTIDGFSIADNVQYKVHIIGEKEWSSPINGNLNDLDDIPFLNKDFYKSTNNPKNYAGIFGKPIDAIMIKGRNYTTSFYSSSECFARGGTCMNPNDCIDGTVLHNICPGDNNSKCCMPKDDITSNNNKSNNNTTKTIIIIAILLVILIIIATILCCYIIRSKNISPTIVNPPNQNNNNEYLNLPPPSYEEVQNRQENNEETIINNQENDSFVRNNSNEHNKVRITPNSSLVVKL